MKLRYYIALWVGKLCYYGLKLFKRQASQHPGYLALKICPDFLSIAKKPNICIAVTGTNGKTTVNNLLTDALLLSGYKVVSNRAGANVDSGCATNLINSLTFLGQSKVDAILFEVDERYSRFILPAILPDYLVVTNLFRDSLKRNSNPDAIFEILDTYCPTKTKLILNADDLGSCFLKENQERTYYSVVKTTNEDVYKNIIFDNSLCPVCHTPLEYNYRHYHHIGQAYCPACDFKSPQSKVTGLEINADNQTLLVSIDNQKVTFPLLSETIFNVYNQVAVITTLQQLGISVPDIQKLFTKLSLPSSRLNQTTINGVTITQAMSKGQSAVSSCRTFDFVSQQPGNKIIILALDDAYDRKNSVEYWGWIYDVDYELLNHDSIKKVIATGPRYLDHQVRLLLAGLPEDKILCINDELSVDKYIDFTDVDSVYILYDTSTFGISSSIKKLLTKRLEEL